MGNDAIRPQISREALAGSFPGDLGITLTEITEERCVGRMPVDRRHLHPGGYVHGGVWTAFADTVAAWARMRRREPGSNFTRVEMRRSVFAGGFAGEGRPGTGEPLHVGRRTQVWEVRVHRERDARLMANFVCTQMILGD